MEGAPNPFNRSSVTENSHSNVFAAPPYGAGRAATRAAPQPALNAASRHIHSTLAGSPTRTTALEPIGATSSLAAPASSWQTRASEKRRRAAAGVGGVRARVRHACQTLQPARASGEHNTRLHITDHARARLSTAAPGRWRPGNANKHAPKSRRRCRCSGSWPRWRSRGPCGND